MAKVFCASSECLHNKNGLCKSKGIYLADKHMHTVHEGFKHLHLCKTYEESKESKEMREFINSVFNGDVLRTPKERGADKTKITCLNCKHLMFSDMYGECNKQLRIVHPSDTCEFAEPKERGGEK